jgi:hypothetical protein
LVINEGGPSVAAADLSRRPATSPYRLSAFLSFMSPSGLDRWGSGPVPPEDSGSVPTVAGRLKSDGTQFGLMPGEAWLGGRVYRRGIWPL